MKPMKFFVSMVAAFVVSAGAPAFAATTNDLKGQTTRLLDQWTTKPASATLSPDVIASFDYATFATEAIKPSASQLNTSQTAKYHQVFEALLKKTVHKQAGTALADTKYSIAEPKITGDKATIDVSARVPKDDTTTSVLFTYKKKGEEWKIVDLSIDGGSLVRDYSNQFGRIIKRDGADALIARLEKRLNGASEESAKL